MEGALPMQPALRLSCVRTAAAERFLCVWRFLWSAQRSSRRARAKSALKIYTSLVQLAYACDSVLSMSAILIPVYE